MKLKDLRKIYRYDKKASSIIVDVQLEDYRDAYSEWDFSPFVNRDLDDDLTEYLLECSYEVPLKQPITINFHILKQEKNELREERSIAGMYNYFSYEIRKAKNYRFRVVKDTVTFFLIGTLLLVASAFVEGWLEESMLRRLLTEGFSIGGWVMMWEMFSAWFFDLKKVSQKIKHFEKLKQSKIIYAYT